MILLSLGVENLASYTDSAGKFVSYVYCVEDNRFPKNTVQKT